jgi:hypothetical protein
MEQVPYYMSTLDSATYRFGWDRARHFLGSVWEYGSKRSAFGTSEQDWSNIRTDLTTMAWLVDPKNTQDNRVKKAYNRLIDPSYFFTDKVRANIRQKVTQKFKSNPGLEHFKLSDPTLQGKQYHDQHVQYISVESSLFSTPDGVQGALGNFALYLVPIGPVSRVNRRITVDIRSVQVHAVDMYDFRGDNWLGCWGPNRLTSNMNPINAAVCVQDFTYRAFRNIKNRGGDFLNMSDRLAMPVSLPEMNFTLE